MSFENRKYSESIIGNSVITCDEIIERTRTVSIKAFLTKTVPIKTIPTSFNKEKVTCKIKRVLYHNHLFINYHVTIEKR